MHNKPFLYIKPAYYICLTLIPLCLLSCSSEKQLVQADSLYKRDVSAGLFPNEPVRGELKPLAIVMEGDAYACSMCHEGFVGDSTQAALEGQHANIEFDHGRNLRCLNCHNPANSDTYVNHDGSEIPGEQPTMLCAKCHGPHFTEWEKGVHGRRNGYWNAEMGAQERVACIQCHNPHHPAFAKMAPMPPPILTRFESKHSTDKGEPAHVE